MKDNVISYLDKIVEFLVEDTYVYSIGIKFPFMNSPLFYEGNYIGFLTYDDPPFGFTLYCHSMYSVDNHIYLWNKYSAIINEKIKDEI